MCTLFNRYRTCPVPKDVIQSVGMSCFKTRRCGLLHSADLTSCDRIWGGFHQIQKLAVAHLQNTEVNYHHCSQKLTYPWPFSTQVQNMKSSMANGSQCPRKCFRSKPLIVDHMQQNDTKCCFCSAAKVMHIAESLQSNESTGLKGKSPRMSLRPLESVQKHLELPKTT